MNPPIEISNLSLSMTATGCAHICRYCLIGKSKIQNIPFDRFRRVAERFIEWNARANSGALNLWLGIDRSCDFDLATFKGFHELAEKLGWDKSTRGIRLGGLPLRTEDETRRWLREWKEEADAVSVHASFAGCGEVHDRWNRRRGDFDFLFRTLSIAADLGLRGAQRIFVARSTLPVLEELLDRLESIDGEALRYLVPFSYLGFARRLEHERIDETIRDRLPARLAALPRRGNRPWRSEREWISYLSEQPPRPREIWLRLTLTEENLERIENTDCAAILAELERETRTACDSLPSRAELRERHGDVSGTRIYETVEDLERMWLDRFFQAAGTKMPSRLLRLMG